jgi:cytidylate kinase
MPGITVSASYGAGGSVVAAQVAQRLGFPLLDRAISGQIAEQLQISREEAEAARLNRPIVERFFAVLTPLAGAVVDPGDTADDLPASPIEEAATFRARAETIMREALTRGAVILGRAGAAAFRDEPDVLRVRLFGPVERRVDQAARIEGVTVQEAAHRLPKVDAARAHYVHRLYHADIDDPNLYHVHIDSTALPPEACADLIVSAYEVFRAGRTGTRSGRHRRTA